jgi:hypothetical protein
MKFSDLGKKTKRAKLELGDGEVIHFDFRHELITPRFVQALLALDESRLQAGGAAEADAAVQSVPENVARVIAWWDVTEDDGETMFPLVASRLAEEIPFAVQVGMLFQCLTEMQPGEARAPESRAAGTAMTSKRSGATS